MKFDSTSIRFGQGYDVHRITGDRPMILGGVTIPCDFGLLGHSDADVLVHSIMDAVLGALALGDIGVWFPDNNPSYRNADSMKLLSRILSDERLAGWKLVNLDATVIAQKPKICTYVPKMRKNIARVFGTDFGNVSIKATTTEGLGYCGRGEGVASTAVVCLCRDLVS